MGRKNLLTAIFDGRDFFTTTNVRHHLLLIDVNCVVMYLIPLYVEEVTSLQAWIEVKLTVA